MKKEYLYQNGMTEEMAKSLVNDRFSAVSDYIKTVDGTCFAAKPRKFVWDAEITEPHLREVTAVFPNGRTAQYCANLNNGIATFIKFND